MQRIIELEGAYNLRDLGGLEAMDGYRVRYGKLFRSDDLGRLTNHDLDTLSRFGIHSVLDLRTDQEIERYGKARLVERGSVHTNISLLSYDPARPAPSPNTLTLGEVYAYMVENNPDKFVEAIMFLGESDHLPIVFHCAAGKDRTGITAALIYSILDVDREDIVRDYVLTEMAMDRINAAIAAVTNAPAPGSDSDHAHAEDSTLRTFLGLLDELHGSPVQWLLESGLQRNVIENLRREMLG